jgi:hypothetical protein
MASKDTGGTGSFSKEGERDNIRIAAVTLNDPKDFSLGYEPTMQHNINRSGSGKSKATGK